MIDCFDYSWSIVSDQMCIRDSNDAIAQLADRIVRIEDGKIVG